MVSHFLVKYNLKCSLISAVSKTIAWQDISRFQQRCFGYFVSGKNRHVSPRSQLFKSSQNLSWVLLAFFKPASFLTSLSNATGGGFLKFTNSSYTLNPSRSMPLLKTRAQSVIFLLIPSTIWALKLEVSVVQFNSGIEIGISWISFNKMRSHFQ